MGFREGLRSPAFGVTVVTTGLSAIVLAIMAALIHMEEERHARTLVESHVQRIAAVDRLAPVSAALADLQITQAAQPNGVFYLVTDPVGGRVAGNLHAWPKSGPDRQGWYHLDPRDTGSAPAMARAIRLDGYYPLIVGRGLDEFGQTTQIGGGLFATIAFAAILLGLLTGAATALRTRARVDQIRASLKKVTLRGPLADVRVGVDEEPWRQLGADFDEAIGVVEREAAGYRAAAGYIAHEMKRPLSRARLALEGLPGTDAMGVVRSEMERALQAYDAMLTITGLTSTAGTPPAPVDLTSIVADVVELHSDYALVRDVELRAVLTPLSVMGWETGLGQLVANLVENAVKFTAPGTVVTVMLEPFACGGVLRVRDQGPGLAAFPEAPGTPFTRGPGAEFAEGTGVGLAVAKSIALQHGASLSWRDRAEGGAEVSVTFPSARCFAPTETAAAGVT